jgi:hypothetical protein
LLASVARDGATVDAYDARQDIASIVIHAARSGGGAVDLPHTFEIERSSTPSVSDAATRST